MPKRNFSRVQEFFIDEDRLVSLYQTSLAVVSTLKLDEILNRVVDCTRTLTGAEKAVLVLTKPAAQGVALDVDTMVVRGQRAAHPEKWWRGEIEQVAKNVVRKGTPLLLADKAIGKSSSLVCVPVALKGRNIGILSAINPLSHGFKNEDILLLTILASHTASAIENARLYERAKKLAAANEKHRIAREMHDSTAQALFGIILSLESCVGMLPADLEEVKQKLKSLQSIANKSLSELRQNILSLRAEAGEGLALSTKLGQQIKEFNDVGGATAELAVQGEERPLPEDVETSLSRILGEALSNVSKHAQATSVSVKVKYDQPGTSLTVKDDGKGFDVQKVLSKVDKRGKMGLINISERVEVLGGSLKIESSPREGAMLEVFVPG